MTYDRPLPPMRNLKKLATWDGPFPMKGYRMVIGANRYGFDDDTIHFLQLFPHDAVFRSRDDFLKRCQDLELFIVQEGSHGPSSARGLPNTITR